MTKKPNLEQQNIRTIMQVLHGCRKDCLECQEEAEKWRIKKEK